MTIAHSRVHPQASQHDLPPRCTDWGASPNQHRRDPEAADRTRAPQHGGAAGFARCCACDC